MVFLLFQSQMVYNQIKSIIYISRLLLYFQINKYIKQLLSKQEGDCIIISINLMAYIRLLLTLFSAKQSVAERNGIEAT